MARARTAVKAKPVPASANSLVASAADVSKGQYLPRRKGTADWQKAAWGFYDTIGEYRYACHWVGNALSRVALQIDRSTDAGPEHQLHGPAVDALASLFDGDTGQSQMMREIGIHLTVPGETYLVGVPNQSGPDEWVILSTDEMRIGQGGQPWTYDRGDGVRVEIPSNALILRIWRPHPRRYMEADAPSRALLPILREIEQLTKHVAATIDSRLAGAGMLLLPSEMTFASPAGETGGAVAVDGGDDPFLMALTEAMITPIEDRANAAAVVPIIIKAPGAVLGEAKHLTFDTKFDDQAQEIRKECIQRLARGLDLPPEVMLGTAESNHWTAWQINESTWQVHIEPLCELICDALTKQYLWPILESQKLDDYQSYYVHYNTAPLRTRPNKANEAISLYDRLELTADALRRETGFDEADKPNDEELAEIVRKKMILSSAPDVAVEAAEELGVLIGGDPDNGDHDDTDMVKDNPVLDRTGQPGIPDRAVSERRKAIRDNPDGHFLDPPAKPGQVPVKNNPIKRANNKTPAAADPDPYSSLALLACCEVLVLRAMEKGRNRITGRGQKYKACPHEQLDLVLAGAWEQIPRISLLTGTDSDVLHGVLDTYARERLSSNGEHDPDLLANMIREGANA